MCPQRDHRVCRRGMRSGGEDAEQLFVKMASYHFLITFSGTHFSAYLLLMVLCEGYIVLDEPEP